ncbi:glutaredoxin-like protein C5orf63 homolog isoform X1 [Ahaetulla prasina]|uniref:glutaredoxin-like protein C5orf63 homolog isoform X1 n=2 Tax=Ahaetulla prasina TaxID=499056 RepID=UPI00264876CA|nr:glutaredoxin-like protein C5orf63 homolog isoform X1 [Ahaetulla prasina]
MPRAKMLWLQSWTLHLTNYSKPLQRMLCEAGVKLPVLTLFTKHPCPLCEEAKMMLEPYKHKFTLEEIDITLPNHSVWLEKYKYEIPVFHLNGKFLMKHRVDTQKLENHLLNLELQDERNK